MEASSVIYNKLEAFIRKYYTNELLRGLIFFTGLGLLYLLFTAMIEYFLWLKPAGRTFLFWLFVAVEIFLLVRFILLPVFRLFRLQKGIDYHQASDIIGNHFSEVGDKLTNFLQLSADPQKSELLLASIEQKASTLRPVPFTGAVNFKRNRRYLPLALIPILLFAFFYLSGRGEIISESFVRVVNYKQQYVPPAPFRFVLLNQKLATEQNKDFVLTVQTEGRVVPESAMIVIGDENYYMESLGGGKFTYRIASPTNNVGFRLEANAVVSADYELEVVEVPTIANFEMVMTYPAYLGRKAETVKGTGNAIVPEGTNVTWRMTTLATNRVMWTDNAQRVPFRKEDDLFQLTRNIQQNTDYQILTSNSRVTDYEKLNYKLTVVKDQYPSITVGAAPDSLKVDRGYLLGQVSDDYGLHKLQVVYYPRNNPKASQRGGIAVKKDIYDRFVFSFPGNLPVEEGISYEYYFEVFDNDALHGYKSSKSSVFSSRIATEDEKQEEQLQQQNDNISGMEKSLRNQEKQLTEMEKLRQMGKEKDNLEFKDQQKVKDFIKRQQQQDELMKEFARKMEENLQKFQPEKKDEFRDELQKRLENAEKDLEKNQRLLDELNKLNEKIQSEELFEKMEQFKQNSKNQSKNLEQLVELTKRFYVEKKAQQLADKLEKLADKQENQAASEKENNSQNQQEINKEFEKIRKELDDLQKENKELKSPMDIPSDDKKEENINDDLRKAQEDLQKNDKQKAKARQKSAAKQMREMSQKMQDGMAAGEMEQMEEDVKMLRQILDNLLAYSFSQENLMKDFKGLKRGSPSFNKNLKIQQELKQQFRHVDDSLFAMSLRNPQIAENITKEVGNVHYSIDKALEAMVESQVAKGASHQQYAITSANKLADFLSDTLNNMQMSLSGSGSGGKPKPGQGKGDMQLPDIIQKQQGLGEKMKEGMKKPGEGEKPGDGKKPGQGQKPGQSGQKQGQGQGSEGIDGEGDARAIMEIYKEQRQLREALQRELQRQGMTGSGQQALDQMKQLEKQLLNKGFNNETLQRVLNLKYELMKLDKALQQQGEEKKRQAESNKKDFQSTSPQLPQSLQEYLNSIEILNRQTLPLRPIYNQKVQEYFKNQ